MNNNTDPKKYVAVAVVVLLFVLIGIYVVEKAFNKNVNPNQNQNIFPSPNARLDTKKIYISSSSRGVSPAPDVAMLQKKQLTTRLPVETDDFVAAYAPLIDRIVVTRKTPYADQAFYSWVSSMGYPELINNIETTVISDKSMEEVQTPYSTPSPEKQLGNLINLFNIFFTPPQIAPKSLPAEVSTKAGPLTPNPQSPTAKYIYYSQCDGPYDSYPLAEGCNICQAGCGPTTVAMILSSYVDKKNTPPYVVDIYKDIGAAACGTGLGYAKQVITEGGAKTSDYILPYTDKQYLASEVASEFRSYIKNGWTIFALASYCDAGCGHYFWITDIDEKGNILAYDPYYGKNSTPPINENSRNPFPKYIAAFGVKK